MQTARVVGNVWATRKEPSLNGLKLLIVEPYDPNTGEKSKAIVAADAVGAGIGELVIVVSGSTARKALKKDDIAVDATIVGIIDEVEVEEGEKG
ncbi:EutN/CcmL family microcompartment protein [Proteiniclasticum sp. SCR006]|uniref:EutN/CcmL family microcompartment protein n=1 Tax=Proteiniclasticum aestuarii TaxID=2817862 RepID=A0A939H6J0_9CLOT|nr:EutN/CcmL family microcompartment protein [Proteiniclasticum aestuarii]MBO1265172.1 EutN/CcmL family microcompartment protein [Proteiniclasticum aestuarii]